MLNLFTFNFEKPAYAGVGSERGHTYWHVVADGYESALAEVRRLAPDAVIRSITQQNYAGSPVLVRSGGDPQRPRRPPQDEGRPEGGGWRR